MDNPTKNTQRGLVKYARFASMGVQMAVTIWAGSMIGKWLDTKFEMDNEVFFKCMTLFAVFGSIFSFIRQVIKLTNENEH